MKKIDSERLVSILANVGVIAGIAFLAIEINQNSDMIQSQTRNEIAQSISELAMFTASDREVMEVWLRGQTELEVLDDIDRQRFGEMATAQLRMWENIYYQYDRGLFEEAEFRAESAVWRQTASTEWFRVYYCQTKPFYSEAFFDLMASMMPSTECSDDETHPYFIRD